jgi:3-deoxy-manno-octulosonate cytidylyltransferase (CMP-KDO synthetase)
MDNKLKAIGIIPARYASSRFPGKPLALLNGRPMIQWVYEACSGIFDYLAVATDDPRIQQEVEGFGGNAVMTSSSHTTGTDRCREAAEYLEMKGIAHEIVVNIQGDEPLIRREQLMELLGCFDQGDTEIATLVRAFEEDEDPADPNIVKVVVSGGQKALYFSRSPVPYHRTGDNAFSGGYLKHIGIYAFRTRVLKKICDLPSSALEKTESLEQLRWLENDFLIRVHQTQYRSIGVDTPEDLKKLEAKLRKRK